MPLHNLSRAAHPLPHPPLQQVFSTVPSSRYDTPTHPNTTITVSNPPQLPPYNHYQNTNKRVRPQNDENFASRPLCGKQASYRPVSTTVGDHVGIPVAELFFYNKILSLFFFLLFFSFLLIPFFLCLGECFFTPGVTPCAGRLLV